jgi:hypothetical protein
MEDPVAEMLGTAALALLVDPPVELTVIAVSRREGMIHTEAVSSADPNTTGDDVENPLSLPGVQRGRCVVTYTGQEGRKQGR